MCNWESNAKLSVSTDEMPSLLLFPRLCWLGGLKINQGLDFHTPPDSVFGCCSAAGENWTLRKFRGHDCVIEGLCLFLISTTKYCKRFGIEWAKCRIGNVRPVCLGTGSNDGDEWTRLFFASSVVNVVLHTPHTFTVRSNGETGERIGSRVDRLAPISRPRFLGRWPKHPKLHIVRKKLECLSPHTVEWAGHQKKV